MGVRMSRNLRLSSEVELMAIMQRMRSPRSEMRDAESAHRTNHCSRVAGVAPSNVRARPKADAANGRQPTDGADAASRAPKYRNKPTNGYASKKEAKRAAVLRMMEEAGQIQGLREQVEFLLIPRQQRPDGSIERSCSYWADFTYDEWTADGWRRVVEDVKGVRTPDYVIKRKLMLMVHGVAIREV